MYSPQSPTSGITRMTSVTQWRHVRVMQSTTDVLKLEFHNKLDLILGSTGNVLSECQTSAELRRI